MRPRKAKSGADQLSPQTYLRSINVQYDAEHPERIAHFQPTQKSTQAIRAFLGLDDDRAFLLVAPYGSGKSLAATYTLHLVEQLTAAEQTLRIVEKRLSGVDPDLERFSASRRRKERARGLVIAIHGYQPSMALAVQSAAANAFKRLRLGRQARSIHSHRATSGDDAIEILKIAEAKALASGLDRIVIVWDEFGRHVEGLLADGRASDLADVQILAEYASRTSRVVTVLALLLHQGLLQYAANVPQSVRNQWTKIAGRFKTIQYIDDSKELYRLIARVVATSRPDRPKGRRISKCVSPTLDAGLFGAFRKTELKQLLSDAYPIEPAALFLLPRVAGRVAQNERTIFDFVVSSPLDQTLSAADLYDFFSSAMRADTAVGGTYRHWLETESALSKVSSDVETRVLKTAALLGFGVGGERSRTGRDLLEFSAAGYEDADAVRAATEDLITRKLLLHRKHTNEVSVWHGTDLDLRARLEDEKVRIGADFDAVSFLEKEMPPPSWLPQEYNSDFCIRRYCESEYVTFERLRAYLQTEVTINPLPPDCDGRVLYVLLEEKDDVEEALQMLHQTLENERVVVAVPTEPLPIHISALEVCCLSRMQLDAELVGADPLALPELQQMADDARGHLQSVLDRLVRPSPGGAHWIHRSGPIKASSARELRRALSKIIRHIYPRTPRINNEMIVRKRPSPVVVNARKKLVLGILERTGQENLGIVGNFPDASMFRTVLLNTGLYRRRNGGWGFARPAELPDSGLRHAWKLCERFLARPSDRPKPLSDLIGQLQSPPLGVRRGLFPILLAAAFRAFPGAYSVTRMGVYLPDMLPSDIEQMCNDPAAYRIVVLDLDTASTAYLRGLARLFGSDEGRDYASADAIRDCHDFLQEWRHGLPPAAETTHDLKARTKKVRAHLFAELDPVEMLFRRIPDACGVSLKKPELLLRRLAACKRELEQIGTRMVESGLSTIRQELSIRRQESVNGCDTRSVASTWAQVFPENFVDDLGEGVAKGFITRCRSSYETEAALLDSLGSLLVGRAVQSWDDTASSTFAREVHRIARETEELALNADIGSSVSAHDSKRHLVELVEGRISDLFDNLEQLVGAETARKFSKSLGRK